MNITNKFCFRLLARFLCVVMVVCSIAALPIVSYATGAKEGTWGGVKWEITQTADSDKYTLTLTADTPTQLPWAWNPNATGTCWDSAHGGEWAATDIDKVVFGNNVTATGTNGVFANYTELKTLELGDSVTTINWNSFYGCTKLATVTGGRNITAVNGKAFEGTGIYGIPASFESLQTIDYNAFQANTEEVTIPATVTKMCMPFGTNCTAVKTLIFEENGQTLDMTYVSSQVNNQGYTLFSGLPSLEYVILPKNVTLPSGAWNVRGDAYVAETATFVIPEGFANEAALTEYVASANGTGVTVMTKAEYDAAQNVVTTTGTWGGVNWEITPTANSEKYTLTLTADTPTAMTYRTNASAEGILWDSLTTDPWDNSVFDTVVFGENVTKPGQAVFSQATSGLKFSNLKKVVFGNAVTELPWACFQNVSTLTEVEGGANIATVRGNTFNGTGIWGIPASFTSIATIEGYAFQANTEEVTIPATVTKMCLPFGIGNTVVKKMVFEEGGQTLDMTYFNKETNGNSTTASATTPTLFSGLGGLETVILPKNIILPDRAWNVQLGAVKASAATFVIPEGFANEAAFREYAASANGTGITVMTEDEYNNPGTGGEEAATGTWGGVNWAITQTQGTEKYTLTLTADTPTAMTYRTNAGAAGTLWDSLTTDPWDNSVFDTVIFGENVTSPGQNVFSQATSGKKFSNLKKVVFSDDVTVLPWACFQNVSTLTEVEGGANITTVKGNAFNGTGIWGIPASFTSIATIEGYAFQANTEEITIPATVTQMCTPFGVGNTAVKKMVFEEGGQTLDMTYFNKETNGNSTEVKATTPTLFSGLGGLETVILPKNIILPDRAWNVQLGGAKSNAATFVMPEGFANGEALRTYAASANGTGITVMTWATYYYGQYEGLAIENSVVVSPGETSVVIHTYNEFEFEGDNIPEYALKGQIDKTTVDNNSVKVFRYQASDKMMLDPEGIDAFSVLGNNDTITLQNLPAISDDVFYQVVIDGVAAIDGTVVSNKNVIVKTTDAVIPGGIITKDFVGQVISAGSLNAFSLDVNSIEIDVPENTTVTIAGGGDSWTADSNGIIDFSANNLNPSVTYTLSINDAVYTSFTTSAEGSLKGSTITIDNGNIQVSLQNLTSSPQTVYLVVMGIDTDGITKDVSCQAIPMAAFSKENINEVITVSGTTYKAVVWKDLNNFEPLTEKMLNETATKYIEAGVGIKVSGFDGATAKIDGRFQIGTSGRMAIAVLDAYDSLIYANDINTADDGSFSGVIVMPDSITTAGEYKLVIVNNTTGEKLTSDICYSPAGVGDTEISEFGTASDSEMTALLRDDRVALGLSNSVFDEMLTKPDANELIAEVAKLVCEEREGISLTKAAIAEIFNEAVTKIAIRHGMLDGNSVELNNLSILDDAPVYKWFNIQIGIESGYTTEWRTKTLAKLANWTAPAEAVTRAVTRTDSEVFDDLFVEALVYAVLSNCQEAGTFERCVNDLIGYIPNPGNDSKGNPYLGSTYLRRLGGSGTDLSTLGNFDAMISMLKGYESEIYAPKEDFGGAPVGSTTVSMPQTPPEIPEENVVEPGASDGNTFKDMTGFEWALEAVNALADKEIISGDGDGHFNPADNVTREEFTKMIVELADLSPSDIALPFEDVSEDDWFCPYIRTAYSNGLIKGISETTFGAGLQISRQDMAVILYNALKLRLIAPAGATMEFADKDDVAEYAIMAIESLSAGKILNGYEDNTFRPEDIATRAEAAQIIYKASLLYNQWM